jgi:hypothetical protein
MTPKQKAKELVEKFQDIDSDAEMFDDFKMSIFYAQRCALISVDEMINYLSESDWALINNKAIYWREVKQEIEKL